MKIKSLSCLISIILVLGSVSFVFASSTSDYTQYLVTDSNENWCTINCPRTLPAGTYTISFNNPSSWNNISRRINVSFPQLNYFSDFSYTNMWRSSDTSNTFAVKDENNYTPSNSPSYITFTYSGEATGAYTFIIQLYNQSVYPDNPIDYYGISLTGPYIAPPVYCDFDLPCGNTLYLDIGQGNNFDLSFGCTFRDTAGGLNSTFSDTFYYTFANSIPQTSSSFTPSVGTYITMYKDMDKANIFGFTKVGYGSISGSASGQYLVIVNPLMFAKTTNVYNTTLHISGIPADTVVYTYPVSSSISGNEVMSTITSPVGGTGTASASGGAISTYSTDDENVVYIPNSGGNSVLNSDENIVEGYLSGLNQTLNDFFNNFISLFSKPISYIQSLIASGSNFISHLAYLWSWLPAEISSVIQSAMIVTISVAVFKVFL